MGEATAWIVVLALLPVASLAGCTLPWTEEAPHVTILSSTGFRGGDHWYYVHAEVENTGPTAIESIAIEAVFFEGVAIGNHTEIERIGEVLNPGETGFIRFKHPDPNGTITGYTLTVKSALTTEPVTRPDRLSIHNATVEVVETGQTWRSVLVQGTVLNTRSTVVFPSIDVTLRSESGAVMATGAAGADGPSTFEGLAPGSSAPFSLRLQVPNATGTIKLEVIGRGSNEP